MSEHHPGTDGEERPSLDRRTILRGAAIGSVAAWATPAILSVDAAAAATCFVGGVVWSSYTATIDDYPASYPFTVPVGPTSTVDVDFTPLGPASTTVGMAIPIFPLDDGPTTSFVEMATSDVSPAPGPGTIAELTLTFSAPVHSLAFSLLDVDRGLGFWQDEVELIPTLGGSPIAPVGASFTLYSGTITHTALPTGDLFTATTDPSGTGSGADNTTDVGRIDLAYGDDQDLDGLVIRYRAGSDEASPLRAQQIGITDLSACAP